jgi:hypothetical protein
MRKFLALGAALAALALALVAGATAGSNPNTLTLAVYGDSPYLDPAFPTQPHAEFAATPAFISTFNADPSIQEVIHVGDIHSGSEPCTVAYDQSIFNDWLAFEKPLIYTPGDNEWSDCSKAKELPGSDFNNVVTHPDMPLEHLQAIRNIFFANPGWSLGQHPMQVVSQANAFDPAHPDDAQYVENVMWQQSKTVFVTLNIPGGSNNDIDPWYAKTHPTSWNPDQATEMNKRTAADVRWLNAAFAQAEAGNAHSVVIVGQADMWDTGDAVVAAHQTNYEPIIQAMADDTTAFGKPVLYLNGDSHVYRSDNPLQKSSTCYYETGACPGDAWGQHPFYDVPNFHRIVVHGSTFPLEWLKLSIDPRAAWENASSPTSFGPVSWVRQTQAQLTPTAS